MVLVRGFKATTIWKAFFIYSLVSSLTIVLALFINNELTTYIKKDNKKDDKKNTEIKRQINWLAILFTFLGAFVSSFVIYAIMYFIFGFGRGLVLVST